MIYIIQRSSLCAAVSGDKERYVAVDCYIQMKKHSDLSGSTERILKSKYLEKEKQKTIPIIHRNNNKIKLADLCPEEKLKIGELIRTLEARKQENQRIGSDFSDLSIKYDQCQHELLEVTARLQQKKEIEQEITQLLNSKDKTIRSQEKYIDQLESELEKYKQSYESISMKATHSKQTQTEIMVVDMSIQTKKKKVRSKDCQVQIQGIFSERNMFYRANSKSFEKIMKGPLPQERFYSQSLQECATTEKFTQKKEKSSGCRDKSSPDINNFEEEAQQCVQSLAKRWQEIKQKSERARNPPSFNISSKRNQDYVVEESDEDDMDDQSGWKGRKGFSQSIEDYDQKYLNKLLKLKNFSASKLFKGSHNSSVNKSGQKKYSPEVSYLKSPYFNDNEGSGSHKHRKAENYQPQMPTDRNINFFESDIMELAERINL